MIPLAAYYSTGCNWSSTRPLDDSSRIMRTLCICIKTPDCLEERIRSRRVGRGPARPTLRSRRCKKRNRDDRKKKKKSAERNTEKWIRPIERQIHRVQTRGFGMPRTIVLRPPPGIPVARLQEPAVCGVYSLSSGNSRGSLSQLIWISSECLTLYTMTIEITRPWGPPSAGPTRSRIMGPKCTKQSEHKSKRVKKFQIIIWCLLIFVSFCARTVVCASYWRLLWVVVVVLVHPQFLIVWEVVRTEF